MYLKFKTKMKKIKNDSRFKQDSKMNEQKRNGSEQIQVFMKSNIFYYLNRKK